MEARLKRDVLREAARYEQHILVTEEDDDMNVSELHLATVDQDCAVLAMVRRIQIAMCSELQLLLGGRGS
jgi:hypothetical protein